MFNRLAAKLADQDFEGAAEMIARREGGLESVDVRGWTCLHHAVYAQAPLHVVRALVETRLPVLDVNFADQRGNTAMHDAGFFGASPELMALLLDLGGLPNKPNVTCWLVCVPAKLTLDTQNFGETSVNEAAIRSSVETMRVLLSRGGDPNVRTVRGHVCVALATSTTDCAAQDEDVSPLEAAISANREVEMIMLLLRYHANMVVRSRKGTKRSLIEVARASQRPYVAAQMERVRVMQALCGGFSKHRRAHHAPSSGFHRLPFEMLRLVNAALGGV